MPSKTALTRANDQAIRRALEHPKTADQECGCGRHQRRSNFDPPQRSIGVIFNAAMRRSPAQHTDRWHSSGRTGGPGARLRAPSAASHPSGRGPIPRPSVFFDRPRIGACPTHVIPVRPIVGQPSVYEFPGSLGAVGIAPMQLRQFLRLLGGEYVVPTERFQLTDSRGNSAS